MESWIWFVIGCIIGIIVGCVVSVIFQKKNDRYRHAGVLRMDHSDPEDAPYLFLELESNGMDVIHRNKTVLLDVNLENYLPRK